MRMFRSMRTMILAFLMLAAPLASFAGIFLSVNFGPPPLPVYEQPLCPSDGYIWTPGYWAYGDQGYFWVPGTWVMAPQVGYLWTPGYWGWGGSAFLFHAGYWGPHIGYYGGINYGFGYIGHGYEGGYWNNGHFDYNRSVNNVNVTNIHNVYNKTVINNNVTRVSYNGGTGGINDRPRPAEVAAMHEQHVQATSMQTQHLQAASTNRAQYVSVNHGQPAVAATARPGAFNGQGVVPARSANVSGNMANRGTTSGRPAASYAGSNSRPLVTARPNTGAAAGNRPAYQNSPANTNRGNYNSPAANRGTQAQYSQRTPAASTARPQYSRPQSAPRPAAAPRQQSAPRSAPAAHESAPREEKGGHEPHGGR